MLQRLRLRGEARRLARFAGRLANATCTRFRHLRAHIRQHQVLQPVAVVARVRHRYAAADAVRDEVERLEVHLLHEAAQVHGERPHEVAAGSVLALAVAAQVRRVDAVFGGEAARDVFPVAPVVHQAVEEHQRLALGRAPAQIVVAQAVNRRGTHPRRRCGYRERQS